MKHLLHSFVVVSQRLANALTATGRSAQRRSAAADPAQESAASAPAFTKAWVALPVLAFLAFASSSQQAQVQSLEVLFSDNAGRSPHYTLNWLPAPGQSAVIKVRARYLYKGEEFGNWCEWHTWTLTGS